MERDQLDSVDASVRHKGVPANPCELFHALAVRFRLEVVLLVLHKHYVLETDPVIDDGIFGAGALHRITSIEDNHKVVGFIRTKVAKELIVFIDALHGGDVVLQAFRLLVDWPERSVTLHLIVLET